MLVFVCGLSHDVFRGLDNASCWPWTRPNRLSADQITICEYHGAGHVDCSSHITSECRSQRVSIMARDCSYGYIYIFQMGSLLFISFRWGVYYLYLLDGEFIIYIFQMGSLLYISFRWGVYYLYLLDGQFIIYIFQMGSLLFISFRWAVYYIYLLDGQFCIDVLFPLSDIYLCLCIVLTLQINVQLYQY